MNVFIEHPVFPPNKLCLFNVFKFTLHPSPQHSQCNENVIRKVYFVSQCNSTCLSDKLSIFRHHGRISTAVQKSFMIFQAIIIRIELFDPIRNIIPISYKNTHHILKINSYTGKAKTCLIGPNTCR
ncbi:U75 [Human betaherpesvirus 6B]|uniref:U75 n=1 Tax=Human herpesvirus 6B TaxID=32604 RepID=Q9WT00_HHV6H|nr:U75 [Human betaherpesvirus 6B]BAA78296.1 U75 [Human betaherpesvirus 6B]